VMTTRMFPLCRELALSVQRFRTGRGGALAKPVPMR
jgi:hypothetical protein